MMPSPTRILYCHCAHAQVLAKAEKEAVLQKLCQSGRSFEAVGDLCELSARQAPALGRLAESGAIKIAACYPRAVKWLFAGAQAPLPITGTEVLNLRTEKAEAVAAALFHPEIQPNLPAGKSSEGGRPSAASPTGVSPQPPAQSSSGQALLQVLLYEGQGAEELPAEQRFALAKALLDTGYAVSFLKGEWPPPLPTESPVLILGNWHQLLPATLAHEQKRAVRLQNLHGLEFAAVLEKVQAAQAELGAAQPGQWMPWFPLIDYELCTNCMQCLSFCLFGVFGVGAQQLLEVQNSDDCKTNCPACSRVCPEAAIIFPKYKSGPINGEPVSSSDLQREKVKVDISALLGGDIYQILRDRSERAQSRFSKERDPDKALQERQKCLAKLALAADIPPEVLMALPSPEEIQRRVEEAKARAQSARQKPDTLG